MGQVADVFIWCNLDDYRRLERTVPVPVPYRIVLYGTVRSCISNNVCNNYNYNIRKTVQISSLDSSESVFMYQGCIYKQYFQRPIFIYGVHALLGIQVTSPTCAGAGITNALLSF